MAPHNPADRHENNIPTLKKAQVKETIFDRLPLIKSLRNML
jgi:hypothetical protein